MSVWILNPGLSISEGRGWGSDTPPDFIGGSALGEVGGYPQPAGVLLMIGVGALWMGIGVGPAGKAPLGGKLVQV